MTLYQEQLFTRGRDISSTLKNYHTSAVVLEPTSNCVEKCYSYTYSNDPIHSF